MTECARSVTQFQIVAKSVPSAGRSGPWISHSGHPVYVFTFLDVIKTLFLSYFFVICPGSYDLHPPEQKSDKCGET